MYESGTIIWSGGQEFQGVICLGAGWWLAFASNDPSQFIRVVKEDE